MFLFSIRVFVFELCFCFRIVVLLGCGVFSVVDSIVVFVVLFFFFETCFCFFEELMFFGGLIFSLIRIGMRVLFLTCEG